MIDTSKLKEAVEHFEQRGKHRNAPDETALAALRILLAAQAAPSAVHAALAAFDAGPKDSQRIEECMEAALLAASLHRPVEARVTEETLRRAKDEAYHERNQIVAALARLYPSGIARTDIPGWEPEWHGCVYIDLPTGQVSWHYHDREAPLFADLPPYAFEWDGHDTPEKYRRLASLPSPQVTREEIARIVCHYATGPSDANSCCPAPDGHKRCQRKADRILSLFGRARP